MSLGLVGKKVGMTRVFSDEGKSRTVTVIEVLPNRITQVRNESVDGYNALQVTTGERRASRVTKAMKGHFAKAGVEPGRGVWEFRLEKPVENELGSELNVKLFSEGQKVDVTGRTIGKGFAGVMKRHGMRGGRASHGNSKAHRLGGSIGNAQDPGRVFKGKKMAGHMGAVTAGQQNLEVVRVDSDRNLILIAGTIPGSKGSDVIIQPSVKFADSIEMTLTNASSLGASDVENNVDVAAVDSATEAATEAAVESTPETAVETASGSSAEQETPEQETAGKENSEQPESSNQASDKAET